MDAVRVTGFTWRITNARTAAVACFERIEVEKANLSFEFAVNADLQWEVICRKGV